MKSYNIFWFIIDSVRTYRKNMDDRDRLDIMDKFGTESIEFTNFFTSAPSSLLAAGGLFTGLPGVFISRHFNDWKFKNKNISTIATLVDEYKYKSYPLLNAREERERYHELLPPLKTKYLPNGFKLSDYAWRNSEITFIFEHILNTVVPTEPFCFTFWYDCRRDSKTSEHVENALNLIKKFNYYDNSIIIMTSDHGYPDPDSKLSERYCAKMGLDHDMMLTDDNIKVPFFIRYPGANCNIKIPNIAGHIDIIPTIFDLLEIPKKKINTKFYGKTLLSIINQKEDDKRIVRSDTRLRMDTGRTTSLRSNPYKFIHYYDDNSNALFDLSKDPGEFINLINQKDKKIKNVIQEFKNIFENYEKELFNFHENQLKSNAKKSFVKLKNKYINQKVKILIVSSAPEELLIILSSYINFCFKCEKIDLIHNHNIKKMNHITHFYVVSNFTESQISKLSLSKYDIVIYLTENSRRVFLKDEIINAVKSINADNYRLMNYNFELFNYFVSKWIPLQAKLFFDWDVKGYFYKQEPLYFFKDFIYFIKVGIKYIFFI